MKGFVELVEILKLFFVSFEEEGED